MSNQSLSSSSSSSSSILGRPPPPPLPTDSDMSHTHNESHTFRRQPSNSFGLQPLSAASPSSSSSSSTSTSSSSSSFSSLFGSPSSSLWANSDVKSHSADSSNGTDIHAKNSESASQPLEQAPASLTSALNQRNPFAYGAWPQAGLKKPQPINIMETCAFKIGLSAIGGFGFGAFLGLFMSSMETTHSIDLHYQERTTREQLKIQMRHLARSTMSRAKSFAVIGAVYSGIECVLEKQRAKHDYYNALTAGCIAGGAFSLKAGPMGMGAGCAGFAAFGYIIDHFMTDMFKK